MKKASTLTDEESGLTVEFRTFTADELTKMGKDPKNWRSAGAGPVAKYLKEMREGRWQQASGIPLILGEKGQVIDGCHRASAAAQFQRDGGDPIRWLVVTGAKQVINEVVDSGLARKFSQWVRKHHGEDFGIMASGVAGTLSRTIWASERTPRGNKMKTAVTGHVAKYVADQSGAPRKHLARPTASELRATFLKHKDLVTRWAQRSLQFHGSTPRIAHSALLSAVLLVAEMLAGRKSAEEFADGVMEWKSLPDGHPAGVLASVLVAIPSRASRARMNQMHVAALMVKALNAFLDDQRIKTLSWRLNESFPTLAVEAAD